MSWNRDTKDEAITSARKVLGTMVTEWLDDGCHPANHVREDGLGNEIARVDRWCGGYQEPHHPVTIGWKVQIGCCLSHDVVLVSDFGTGKRAIKKAIAEAKRQADEALTKLRKDSLVEGHSLSLVPKAV
jgi:hypothetical protein